jgi:hypothetical protein
MHCVSSDDVTVYRCEELSPVDSLGELMAWMEANDRRGGPPPAQEEHDRAEAYAAVLKERCGDDRLPPEDEEPAAADDELLRAADFAQDAVFGAGAAAQRLSVNLERLGPHTEVRGSGVLAVPRSLRDRPRRGTLPI